MKKILAVILFLVIAPCLCVNALALETYIPHITRGSADWTDYLQVNNNKATEASFTLTLYSSGTQIFSQVFSVGGFSRSQILLKALNPDAETGVITYSEPGLVFRVSYKSTGGGVAEFRTMNTQESNLMYCFSDFTGFVQWKGAAIANMGTKPARVTLYALGGSSQAGSGGAILDTRIETIDPKNRIAQLHGAWFNVGLNEIESIVAVTSSPALCGIAISSDQPQSHLLFTPAIAVPNFDAQTPGDAAGVQ